MHIVHISLPNSREKKQRKTKTKMEGRQSRHRYISGTMTAACWTSLDKVCYTFKPVLIQSM